MLLYDSVISVARWMDGWVGGCINRWINRWVGECVNGTYSIGNCICT